MSLHLLDEHFTTLLHYKLNTWWEQRGVLFNTSIAVNVQRPITHTLSTPICAFLACTSEIIDFSLGVQPSCSEEPPILIMHQTYLASGNLNPTIPVVLSQLRAVMLDDYALWRREEGRWQEGGLDSDQTEELVWHHVVLTNVTLQDPAAYEHVFIDRSLITLS